MIAQDSLKSVELFLLGTILEGGCNGSLARLRPILRDGSAFSTPALADVWRCIDRTQGAVTLRTLTSELDADQLTHLMAAGGITALSDEALPGIDDRSLVHSAQRIAAAALHRAETLALAGYRQKLRDNEDLDVAFQWYCDERRRLRDLFGRPDPFTDSVLWGQDLAQATLPTPTSVLGHGLLVQGSYGLLVGAKGSGKSWIGLELATRIAAGEPCFGLPTAQAKAMVISLELPASTCRDRITAIRGSIPEQLGVLGTDAFAATPARPNPPAWPRLAFPASQDRIIETVRAEKIGFLLIDPLGPSVQTNENEEMPAIADGIRRIAVETGISVLAVHHPRKSTPGTGKERGVHALRGASQLGDWACIVLELRMSRGLYALGTPPESGPRYAPEIEPVWLDRAPNGAFKTTAAPREREQEAEEKRAMLRELLEERGEIQAGAAADYLGLSKPTVRKHLEAIGAEAVGPRAATRWRLPHVENGKPRGGNVSTLWQDNTESSVTEDQG